MGDIYIIYILVTKLQYYITCIVSISKILQLLKSQS